MKLSNLLVLLKCTFILMLLFISFRVLFSQTAQIYEELIHDNFDIEVVINKSPPRERCFSIKLIDDQISEVKVNTIVELLDLRSPFSELRRMDDNSIIEKISNCL